MKQLSTDLNNTSHIAEKMECVPVEQKFSLTKEDGKMITQEVAQFQALTPQEATDKALMLLQKLGNLQETPRRTYNWMYSFRTNDDAPPIIEVKCLTKEAFGYGKQIAQEIAKPISKQEFAVLYAKLRVLCKWHSVPADEKTMTNFKNILQYL